jgi:steroid delta-isomerase-like uncharacterized protein
VGTALAHCANPETRERYFDLYSPEIVFHGYDGVAPGLASVKQFYGALWSAFPDARVDVEEFIESGDKVVVRFAPTGTHLGIFNGIPATGRAFRMPGITILRFENGKCVERRSIADFMKLMAQIAPS